MAEVSYELHADLAKQYDGKSAWGYRHVASADCDLVKPHPDDEQTDAPQSDKGPLLRSPADVDWVKPNIFKWFKVMGETAQVHPYQFTTAIAKLAQEKGVKVLHGRAMSIKLSQNDEAVQSVIFRPAEATSEQQLLASDVIVAAGPWTKRILPQAPIVHSLSTSILVDPKREISPHVLFFDPGHFDSADSRNSMEIYPRPDHTVYISGQSNKNAPLPDSTDDVPLDPDRVGKTIKSTAIVSGALREAEFLKGQACFRPILQVEGRGPQDSSPLLGETGVRGLLLAAGHNHWGIQNGPATGKVLSELVLDGVAKCCDIRELDPREHLHFARP